MTLSSSYCYKYKNTGDVGYDVNNVGNIVCFIPSLHSSYFFYVNNRLWFEIYGNR